MENVFAECPFRVQSLWIPKRRKRIPVWEILIVVVFLKVSVFAQTNTGAIGGAVGPREGDDHTAHGSPFVPGGQSLRIRRENPAGAGSVIRKTV